jgi:hypothetical protein
MKRLYSNDRNAPRMRKGEFSYHLLNEDVFKEFKEANPDYKDMTYQQFYKYWCHIAETIRLQTVKNPLGVKLGSYCGELKFQHLPYKFNAINHSLSDQLGEKVNQINLVSRGKVAKLKWERRWAVKFHRMLQFFAFEPTREMSLMAKDYIDENPEKLRVSRNTLGGKSLWKNIKNG